MKCQQLKRLWAQTLNDFDTQTMLWLCDVTTTFVIVWKIEFPALKGYVWKCFSILKFIENVFWTLVDAFEVVKTLGDNFQLRGIHGNVFQFEILPEMFSNMYNSWRD